MAAVARSRMLNVVVPAGMALGLAAVIGLDFGASSPGGLAAVHASVDGLRGSGGCAACHGGEGRSLARACTECHAEIGAQLENRRGLHGQLTSGLVMSCGRCHTEHRGDDSVQVGDRAFIAAGFAEGVRGFRHEGLGFTLTGEHDELSCAACHRHADVRVLPAGRKRFLGLQEDCASCHDDPHEGRLPGCAECHGQERPFAEAASFVHDARVPLTGSHAHLACKSCHEPSSPHSIEAAGSSRASGQVLRIRGCAECHASPHTSSFVTAVATLAQVPRSGACELCHDPSHESLGASDLGASRRWHAGMGFELAPPHSGLDCRHCHDGIGAASAEALVSVVDYARRFPGRDAEDCASCHESLHSERFLLGVERLAGVGSGRACLLCHGSMDRSGNTDRRGSAGRSFHTIDVESNRRWHDAAGFELRPPHDRADCRECHTGIGSRVAREASERRGASEARAEMDGGGVVDFAHEHDRRFPGRESRQCSACHEGPHRSQFEKGAFAGARCTECHDTTAFQPSSFTAHNHASTRFPLTGAHRAVGCRVCHERAAPSAHLVFRAAPTKCDSCHPDVHEGHFDSRLVLEARPRATGCARCHDTASFRAEPGTFDHAKWTRFPLLGGHGRAACAQCHPSEKPTHGGSRRFARAPTRCAECHADPHAGQFAVRGETSCARCHTPTRGFASAVFDHDRDSRFKLEAEHARLSCGRCHESYALPNGGEVVRYKPLGRQCRDCHGWRSTREADDEKSGRKQKQKQKQKRKRKGRRRR